MIRKRLKLTLAGHLT